MCQAGVAQSQQRLRRKLAQIAYRTLVVAVASLALIAAFTSAACHAVQQQLSGWSATPRWAAVVWLACVPYSVLDVGVTAVISGMEGASKWLETQAQMRVDMLVRHDDDFGSSFANDTETTEVSTPESKNQPLHACMHL
jgi:hypothetical protein